MSMRELILALAIAAAAPGTSLADSFDDAAAQRPFDHRGAFRVFLQPAETGDLRAQYAERRPLPNRSECGSGSLL
jgi:hypothetical protein